MTARRPAHPGTPRRGRQPTRAKGRPHVAVEDPDTPGVCHICRRPMTQASDRHLDQHPPTDPDVTAEEARRLGEHD